MTLNGRTLLMGFVVLAVMLVSASIIIDQADDSDAKNVDNGLTITAGQTKTFTWSQVTDNLAWSDYSIAPDFNTLALTTSTSFGNWVNSSLYSLSAKSTGITLTTNSSLSAGTYYIYILVHDEMEQEIDEDYSKITVSTSSGSSTTTNYKVTFSASPSSYGSVSTPSITVAKGTTYTASGNKITFSDGQSVTATAASSTSSYTYSFSSWSSSSGTITSAKTIKANFTQTAVTPTTYSVTVYRGDWDSFYWYDGDDTTVYKTTSHKYTVNAGDTLDIDWSSSNTSGSGSGTGYTYTWSSDSECQYMATSNGGTSIGNSVTIDSSGLKYYPATTKESTKTYTYTYNYTITYNANGGTGAPSNTTTTSTSNSYSTSTTKTIALSSTTPTRSSTSGTGYTTAYSFQGWSTSSTADSADYQPGKSYSFSYGTTQLFAVWKETKTYSFTITYDANTGTGAPSSTNGGTSTSSSKNITLSSTIPTKSSVNGDGYTTSYTFLGWAETSTAKSAAYEAGKSYNFSYGTTPLYAVWSQTTTYSFTIQYDVNGGSGTISDTTGSGTSSSKQLTLSSVKPTKANTTGTNTVTSYTFLGWSESSTATKADYQSGNAYSFNYGTTKLYAVYSPTVTYKYTIEYNTNGGSSVDNTTDSATTTTKEVTLTNTVPTKSGKTFLGWADLSTATTPDYQKGGKLTMNYGSKTVYAVWKNAVLEFSVDIDNRNINQGQTRTIAISEKSGESVTVTVSGATWATYSNGYITLNPTTTDAPGTYHITVEMSKDGYSTITQTFDVTVKSKLSFGSPTVGVIAYAL